jgi:uncharacterized radical SAM superfamily protein
VLWNVSQHDCCQGQLLAWGEEAAANGMGRKTERVPLLSDTLFALKKQQSCLLEIHPHIAAIVLLYDVNVLVLKVIGDSGAIFQVYRLIIEIVEHFFRRIVQATVEVNAFIIQLFYEIPGQLKSFEGHI